MGEEPCACCGTCFRDDSAQFCRGCGEARETVHCAKTTQHPIESLHQQAAPPVEAATDSARSGNLREDENSASTYERENAWMRRFGRLMFLEQQLRTERIHIDQAAAALAVADPHALRTALLSPGAIVGSGGFPAELNPVLKLEWLADALNAGCVNTNSSAALTSTSGWQS